MSEPPGLASALDKRDRVLHVLDRFVHALNDARTDQQLEGAVLAAREQVVVLQGAPSDRRYLARTLCQMAATLRRRHSYAASRRLMEWSIEQGTVDSHICAEMIQACLLDGH